jgi:predicted ribosome quality control (RQC) complex YloA/Tae2 family protein
MIQLYFNDYLCLIGQNKKENWYLLDTSKNSDILFHLSSFPSCYVILKTTYIPPKEVIFKCAELCRSNTKYKNLKNIKVDYSLCSNITKGEKVGELEYKSNKKVSTI